MIDRSLFTQNADLVVIPSTSFPSAQSGPAHTLDLTAFTKAADLVRWEFAAYDSYGQERCEAEHIETLADLFGPAFETAFRNRHRVLLTQKRLAALRVELEQIQAAIGSVEAIILSGGAISRAEDATR